jgi:ParB family transcriptional regulator, chromosome partitioning protein
MEFNSIFDSVSLAEIDWDDHRFRVSSSGPSGPLAASIERVGVITPPVLLKKGSACIIVCGFKRLDVCKQLGLQRINAQILDSGTPFERCVHIVIIDNNFSRELNLVEQGRIVQLLDQLYSDPNILCKEAKRLGLPLNYEMASKLRKVAQMNTVLQKALIEGHIALPVALQLNEMTDAPTANKISRIFGEIGLGLNRQREFIDWLNGISRRERISLHKVIEDRELNEIIDDADTDRKQKSLLVRQYFKNRRYPEISKTEQRYHAFIQTLNLGKGVQLIPPAHFEGQTYAIKINFTHYEELVSRYQDLEKNIQSSQLQSLWNNFGIK